MKTTFHFCFKLSLSSSSDETSVAPNEKVLSFFSKLLTKIKRNPSLSLTFYGYEIDSYRIKYMYKRFPLDSMLSLKILDEIQLVYLTYLALKDFFNEIFEKDLIQNLSTQNIFACFNEQILIKLRKKFTCADSEDWKEEWKDINVEWNDRKKLVCTMLSILQRLGFSTKSFLELKPYERKISPRTYIRIISNLIEDIEMDFEAGAYKTYLQLQHFSKKYDGEIPTRGPHQEIILTLVNLFHFYSHQIISFNPTSLKLDNCTPKFLALLVLSSDCDKSWEEIFAFFISNSVISDAKSELYWDYIFPIFIKHQLKDDTHPSIVLTKLQGENLDTSMVIWKRI